MARAPGRCRRASGLAVSHTAIAAALALEGVSGGERLAAFSLASFANREGRAWPGTPAAAARAGLSRARFLEAREQLVRGGLVRIEDPSRGGRGRASIVALRFAHSGPWWDANINAELFEAVLAGGRSRGSARLLLAAMAALSDHNRKLELVTTEELCRAAGIANSTYRRSCAALLASGAATMIQSTGGRGKTNRWSVARPEPTGGRRPVRVAPPVGSIPLVATIPVAANPAQSRTVSALAEAETPLNPGRFLRGTPPQTPPQTPPPNARAGKEPQNPRTRKHPPNPPHGGSAGDVALIEESYVTARGRKRRRAVTVDLSAVRSVLADPTAADERDWEKIRTLIAKTVGESTFAMWIQPLELAARDAAHALVVAAPPPTRGWVTKRFGRLVSTCGARVGRDLRLADDVEYAAVASKQWHQGTTSQVSSINEKEAI